jgi:hypothetical protein
MRLLQWMPSNRYDGFSMRSFWLTAVEAAGHNCLLTWIFSS